MVDTPVQNRGRITRKPVNAKKTVAAADPKPEATKPEATKPEAKVESSKPAKAAGPAKAAETAKPVTTTSEKTPSASEQAYFLKPIVLKLETLFPKAQVQTLLKAVGPESHHALVRLVRYLWPMRDGVMITEKVLKTAPDRLSGLLFAMKELQEKDSGQYENLLAFLKTQQTIPQPFSAPYLFRGFGTRPSQSAKEMKTKKILEEMGLA